MISIEYLQLRQIAKENDLTMRDHPCVKGNGKCCEKDIVISDADASFILEGVETGDVSESVVNQAINNLSQGLRCPFLGKENECTIYERRPLICIATGTMAFPSIQNDARVMDYDGNSGGFGLPFKKLSSTMCRECHTKLSRQGKGVSVQALRDSQEIAFFYGRSLNMSMREFIVNKLVT